MPNYNADMDAADKEAEKLLLVIPTGEPDVPLTVQLGSWGSILGRWEGDWRHGASSISDKDPIAWATVPEIDAGLYERLSA